MENPVAGLMEVSRVMFQILTFSGVPENPAMIFSILVGFILPLLIIAKLINLVLRPFAMLTEWMEKKCQK